MISSSRSSNMRRRGANNSDVSTFNKLKSSMKRMTMSTLNKSKKDDDWSESWIPSKITDLENGITFNKSINKHSKRRMTDNILLVIMGILGCTFLGGVVGWMRGAPVHDSSVKVVSGDSVSAADLIKMAQSGEFAELHQSVMNTIDNQCGKNLKSLDDNQQANFRSHVLDLIQFIADNGKWSLNKPVVTSQGGIVEKSKLKKGESGNKCVLLNDLRSESLSGTVEDTDHRWDEGYDEWLQSSHFVLTGDVKHDSRSLVVIATQKKVYDVEMDFREATSMHCQLKKLNKKALYNFHGNVMDVFDKLITHRTHFEGYDFKAGISKDDGHLVDTEGASEDEYFTCDFISETISHITSTLESAVELLIKEVNEFDYYSAELQTDLILEQFGSKTVKKFDESSKLNFRAHFIDLVFQIATGHNFGDEKFGLLSDGKISTKKYAMAQGYKATEFHNSPIIDVLLEYARKNNHDTVEADDGRFASESDAYTAEHEYLENNKNKPDATHDAKYLLERAAFRDTYALERSVPEILNTHCSNIAQADEMVKEYAHDNVMSLVWNVAVRGDHSMKSPRFTESGGIFSSTRKGTECAILNAIVGLGKSGDYNKPVTSEPSSTPTSSSKQSTQQQKTTQKQQNKETSTKKSQEPKDQNLYESEEIVSDAFAHKELQSQVATIIKHIRENDLYDAEVEVWYMIESKCGDIVNHLMKSDKPAESVSTFHNEMMAYIKYLSFADHKERHMITVDKDGQLWIGASEHDDDHLPCKTLDVFQDYVTANPASKDKSYADLSADEINKELHREGHESHADDVSHDINLLIEDIRLGHVIDLEKDIDNDLKTHCSDMMSKLRTSAKRKLHAKIAQAAQWIANGNSHRISGAVVTSQGTVVEKSSVAPNTRVFECTLVNKLFER